MYDKVKELTKKCTQKGRGSITDKNGTNAKIWDTSGQSILKEEVEKAIQWMEKGNATGSEEISTQMLRALEDQNIDVITNLCSIIYNSWVIPTDLKQSIFITLPEKSEAQTCTEYRTINLMSHITVTFKSDRTKNSQENW